MPEAKELPSLRSAAPCFAVANVGETIRWYEEVLGFDGHPFPQHEPYAFGIIERDQIEIMLQRLANYQKPNLYNSRDGGVWDAYIRMRGVREFYDLIKDRVEILRPLQKQFYGDWEFEVKDPNGYVLVFSELIDE
ncbi:MAG: VOC family protein [Pyrinomonadaceae bacterium]